MNAKSKNGDQTSGNTKDFKNAVRLGVIKQLYKDNYISDSQYALLLNNDQRENKVSHII